MLKLSGLEKKDAIYRKRIVVVVNISSEMFTDTHFYWVIRYDCQGLLRHVSAEMANNVSLLQSFFFLSIYLSTCVNSHISDLIATYNDIKTFDKMFDCLSPNWFRQQPLLRCSCL